MSCAVHDYNLIFFPVYKLAIHPIGRNYFRWGDSSEICHCQLARAKSIFGYLCRKTFKLVKIPGKVIVDHCVTMSIIVTQPLFTQQYTMVTPKLTDEITLQCVLVTSTNGRLAPRLIVAWHGCISSLAISNCYDVIRLSSWANMYVRWAIISSFVRGSS